MAEGWFVTTHKLRFNDCDAAGHVNNAVYATMAEAGRTDLLIAAGLTLPNPNYAMALVRIEIDFIAEMTWPGDVVIETSVTRFGTKSMHLRQVINTGGRLAARAVSVLAAIDATTRRAFPLDAAWQARFVPWIVPV